jgi:transcriptional regulator GlxA family with amidase domain
VTAESRRQKAGTEPPFETWHGDPSEVCKWIDQHLGRIRTSEDIADFFGVEAETLRRAFARNGIGTLWKYVQQRRIERMEWLLVQSDMKCQAICVSVGLREDTGARLFKQAVGLTMQEYRLQSRTQKQQRRSDSGSNQNSQPF